MDNETKNGHKHGTCGGVSLVKVVVLDRYKLYFLIKSNNTSALLCYSR